MQGTRENYQETTGGTFRQWFFISQAHIMFLADRYVVSPGFFI